MDEECVAEIRAPAIVEEGMTFFILAIGKRIGGRKRKTCRIQGRQKRLRGCLIWPMAHWDEVESEVLLGSPLSS